MLNLAETAVAAALKQGAAEAEAFAYEGKATMVGIERGQINKTNRIIDRGLAVRVQVNKAIGFAYTNIIDNQATVENTITKALAAAKASKPDPNWKSLPEKKPYPSAPEKGFDKKILELRAEDLVNLSTRMLDAATETDKRVLSIEGGASAGYGSNAIANSHGVSGFDEGTMVECSLATLAKEGNTVTPVCFEFSADRTLNVDPEWVGKEAARLAVSALKTTRIETKNYKLIFTQFALQELLYYTLINAVKADSVERDQSPFKDRTRHKSRLRSRHHDRRRLTPWWTTHRHIRRRRRTPSDYTSHRKRHTEKLPIRHLHRQKTRQRKHRQRVTRRLPVHTFYRGNQLPSHARHQVSRGITQRSRRRLAGSRTCRAHTAATPSAANSASSRRQRGKSAKAKLSKPAEASCLQATYSNCSKT